MIKTYIIHIESYLDTSWSEYFQGLEISHIPTGKTELKGDIQDQAMLYGILRQIQDLGLELLLVQQINGAQTET